MITGFKEIELKFIFVYFLEGEFNLSGVFLKSFQPFCKLFFTKIAFKLQYCSRLKILL